MQRNDNSDQQQPAKTTRRQLLCLTGAGIGLALGRPAIGNAVEPKRILKRGDIIDVASGGAAIVQKAYELGYEYEKKHGGCARCTVAALQDAVPFVAVNESLFRGASCLDGGATPTGNHSCGGFTGAGMVIGHVCGSTRAGATFQGDAKLAHQLIHKVYDRFEQEYGSVLCAGVRMIAERDCPKVVGRAAQWTAEVLLAEFTDYTPTGQTSPSRSAKTQSKPAAK